MANQYSFEIGSTYAGMVNVETLASASMPAPHAPPPQLYEEYITLGDNSVSGIGLPIATWRFGELTAAQRDALRAYCTGPSSIVFIKTQGTDNNNAYIIYTGIMVFPLQEERDATRRLNTDIIFKQLTVYTP